MGSQSLSLDLNPEDSTDDTAERLNQRPPQPTCCQPQKSSPESTYTSGTRGPTGHYRRQMRHDGQWQIVYPAGCSPIS